MNETQGIGKVRTDLPDGFHIFHLMQPIWDPDEPMAKIFSGIMSLQNLTHVGTGLWFKGGADSGPSRPRLHACGGILRFELLLENLKALAALNKRFWDDESHLVLSCSKCNMKFGIHAQEVELKNIIFHLMLKQMMPDLPFCNFLNCSDIRALELHGVISLSARNLCTGDYPEFWPHHDHYPRSDASLAFRIASGMDTQSGFCDLDGWASLLMIKKFVQMKEILASLPSELLGPKPMKL
jgi:hypothetical protein